MKVKKVLMTRKYKAGYIIRHELIDCSEYGTKDMIMKRAYTHNGDYIGDIKMAYWLCKKMGVKPEKISPDCNICSVGFCEAEQKWVAWSHHAMCKFGIGSTVKNGDCAYTPASAMFLYSSLSEDERSRVVKMDGNGIIIECDGFEQVPASVDVGEEVEWVPCEPSYYTIETGRGEWTAHTLEDARQMAVDFAGSVS